ncbi:MAG: hypothetical protein LAQ69_22490 [Acidobacteriia bacterium]|nr:hypothetical protein [Terriglobia bacterium]
MRGWLIGLAAVAVGQAAGPTTTVTAMMTSPAGDLISGSCVVQAVAPFTAAATGYRVIGVPITVPFARGVFSVAVAPTDTATPAGQGYKVTCAVPRQILGGRSVGPYAWGPSCWHIPTSAGSLDVGAVEVAPSLCVPSAAPGVVVTAGLNFADQESPAGTIDGINGAFTLAHTPSPAAALQLFRNGLAQKGTSDGTQDYALSGATVTFVSGAIPQVGDTLLAWYRY